VIKLDIHISLDILVSLGAKSLCWDEKVIFHLLSEKPACTLW